MSSISTGRGDGGSTHLYSGEAVCKDDPRIEAVGDLDELVSALGVARAHNLSADTSRTVLELQRQLFAAGSEIASAPEVAARLARRIDREAVEALAALRAGLESRSGLPEGFVLPGESPGGAHLDLARSVARRFERRVAALARAGKVNNEHLVAWVNRLSDVLWLLARAEEGRSRPLESP